MRDGSMTQRHTAGPVRGTFERSPQAVDGESHHGDGPLMVSWRAARREAANPRFGRDVVLHEFAHKIDMRDGVLDGTPLLPDDDERQRWVDVCTPRYEAVRDGDPGELLRSYAGTNPGEFFAVATETFFTRSVDLAERHPGSLSRVRRASTARIRRHAPRPRRADRACRHRDDAPRIVVRRRP